MFILTCIAKRLTAISSILLLATSASTFALPPSTNVSDEKAKADALAPVNDGPYVFVNEQQQLESYWLCQGGVLTQTTKMVNFPLSVSACNMPAAIHALSSIENKVL